MDARNAPHGKHKYPTLQARESRPPGDGCPRLQETRPFGAPQKPADRMSPDRSLALSINIHLFIHSATIFFCTSSMPGTRNNLRCMGHSAYPEGHCLGGRCQAEKSRTGGHQCCNRQMTVKEPHPSWVGRGGAGRVGLLWECLVLSPQG